MVKVVRFVVVIVTAEYLEIIQVMPEAAMATSVKFGDKWIKGPQEKVFARSMDEAMAAAVEQAKKLQQPEGYIIILTESTAFCSTCDGDPNTAVHECPHAKHLGFVNRSAYLDPVKLLEKAAS